MPARSLTPFQSAILGAIRRIPKGKAASYGEVARAAGNPKAPRAVVAVLKQFGATLPWHRVVATGGRVALPGHAGMEQRFLLEQEGVTFQGRRVHPDHLYEYKAQRALTKW